MIDACAAPGNKTTHLAMIMKNQGTLFSFDSDPKRFMILKKMSDKAGAKGIVNTRYFKQRIVVNAKCQSFLEVDPNDSSYKTV